ncbi:MAG: hypothetical protein IJ583_03270 [Firmicutes bacterium]|nr:hypothetical protein [Bacillota bacterium]
MTYYNEDIDIKKAEKPIIFKTASELIDYADKTNNPVLTDPFTMEEIFSRIFKENKIEHTIEKKTEVDSDGRSNQITVLKTSIFAKDIPFEDSQKKFYEITGMDFTDLIPDVLYEKQYLDKKEYQGLKNDMIGWTDYRRKF